MKLQLLLIDDNPADVRLVREVLAETPDEAAAFELHWAGGLQSGIDVLAQTPIDLVLLDLSLPESQGLETVQRLHAHAPETPVVVLTGCTMSEPRVKRYSQAPRTTS